MGSLTSCFQSPPGPILDLQSAFQRFRCNFACCGGTVHIVDGKKVSPNTFTTRLRSRFRRSISTISEPSTEV